MGQIYIEGKWVSKVGIETPFRHLYLVYRPTPDAPMGDWDVLRAGPEGDFVLGNMIAELGTSLQKGEDKYSEGETPEDRGSRLLYDGPDAWDLWGDMVEVATDISGKYSHDALHRKRFGWAHQTARQKPDIYREAAFKVESATRGLLHATHEP